MVLRAAYHHDIDTAMRALAPLLEDETVPKYAHNSKFEYLMCKRMGVQLRGCHDTKAMAYVLGFKDTSLKVLSGEVLGYRQMRFNEWDGEDVKYPADDGATTWLIAHRLWEQMEADGVLDVYLNIELPAIPVIAEMEDTGVYIDRAALMEAADYIREQLDIIEAEFADIDLNRPEHKRWWLFDPDGPCRLTPPVKTATGKASVAKGVLDQLDHPDAARMREWSELNKLWTSYAESLPRFIQDDGRIRTKFVQFGGYDDHDEGRSKTGQATGRIGSYDPNLMQIPHRTELGRRVRRAVRATPGWKLIKADIANEEPRVAALLSNDPALLAIFESANADPYLPIAQMLYDFVHPDEPHTWQHKKEPGVEKWRDPAKQMFLGKQYGARAAKLFKTLHDWGLPVSMEQAEEIDSGFDALYPGIARLAADSAEFAHEFGYVQTWFGRKRWLPGIWSGNNEHVSKAERDATNTRVQGTSADILKLWIVRVARGFQEAGLRARLLLTVHDEIVCEAPEEECDQAVEIIESGTVGLLPVPLPVEATVGDLWG